MILQRDGYKNSYSLGLFAIDFSVMPDGCCTPTLHSALAGQRGFHRRGGKDRMPNTGAE